MNSGDIRYGRAILEPYKETPHPSIIVFVKRLKSCIRSHQFCNILSSHFSNVRECRTSHTARLTPDLGIEIVSGDRAQKQGKSSDEEAFSDEFSDISDSDSSEGQVASACEPEPVMEIIQLFSAVNEAVTSLYKLSIAIRKPTPRDRYAKATSSTPFDASYDVGHVYEKFPHVRSKPWLIDKMGRAITRRREFLRYRENHRERLGSDIGPTTDFGTRHKLGDTRKIVTNRTDFQKPEFEPQFTDYSQLPSTKATTYVANLNDDVSDIRSTADRSETSYVTSILEDDLDTMRQIPEPPKESANGMPFECPYCLTIQSVRTSKHWR